MRLGAHVSTAGGISKAFDRAIDVTAECMQVFTRNQRQWVPKPLDPAEVEAFRKRRRETGIGPNLSHASYLVNLATDKPDLEEKSVAALLDEVRRCDALGIEFLVFHPGSSPDKEAGIARIAERLDRIIEEAGPESTTTILLENTAGAGNTLGRTFAELQAMLEAARHDSRLGICIDTCHAFAAGYDYSTSDAYAAMLDEIEATVTLARVKAFHINDSLKEFGSRKDRHAGISEGLIGLEPLSHWLNDGRWQDHPATLETPEAEKAYKKELKTLRGLVK